MTTTHEKNALEISSRHLIKLLHELPTRFQKEVINSAASAGAEVIRKQAQKNIKQNGSVKTGTLHDSLKKKKARGQIGIYKVFSDKSAPHSHLVEFGTGPRKLKKPKEVYINGRWVTIEQTGSMPAKPFLRPAMDENHELVMRKIAERWQKRGLKIIKQMSQDYRTLSKTFRRKMAE